MSNTCVRCGSAKDVYKVKNLPVLCDLCMDEYMYAKCIEEDRYNEWVEDNTVDLDYEETPFHKDFYEEY